MPRQSIKQRADGRYRVKYKGRDFYGATQSEAIEKREAYKREIARGLRAESIGITFNDYAMQWIHTYKSDCKKNTYNAYARIINSASATIGTKAMKGITRTDILSLFNAQQGKSASHIKKYCMTLNSLFSAALEDGLILRNPCYKAKRPSGKEGTHRALTPEERILIQETASEHDMGPAAMVMMLAGLRRGEVIALNLDSDYDRENQRLRVDEAVSFEGNKPILGAPKTASGIRTIPVILPLQACLINRSGFLLTRESGEIMSESAFDRKWQSYITFLETKMNGCHKRWYGKTKEHKKILADGGTLPEWKPCTIRPHDLRHTFATILYDSDVDIKTAVRWMGHKDEKMILRIYAHLSKEREKRSENQVSIHVENYLKGSKQGSKN